MEENEKPFEVLKSQYDNQLCADRLGESSQGKKRKRMASMIATVTKVEDGDKENKMPPTKDEGEL